MADELRFIFIGSTLGFFFTLLGVLITYWLDTRKYKAQLKDQKDMQEQELKLLREQIQFEKEKYEREKLEREEKEQRADIRVSLLNENNTPYFLVKNHGPSLAKNINLEIANNSRYRPNTHKSDTFPLERLLAGDEKKYYADLIQRGELHCKVKCTWINNDDTLGVYENSLQLIYY